MKKWVKEKTRNKWLAYTKNSSNNTGMHQLDSEK